MAKKATKRKSTKAPKTTFSPKALLKWPIRLDLVNPRGDHAFLGYASKVGAPQIVKGKVGKPSHAAKRIKELTKALPSNWSIRMSFRDVFTGKVVNSQLFAGKLEPELVFKKVVVVDLKAPARAKRAREKARAEFKRKNPDAPVWAMYDSPRRSM
jgi:hypothetical protein